MTEVSPGIHRLSLPMPPDSSLKGVNVYLVQGDKDCLLVDAGWNTAEGFDSLRGQLSAVGVTPRDISRVVITHIHPDHFGLTGHLKEVAPVRIIMHRLEGELIDSRYIHLERLLEQIAEWLILHGVPDKEVAPLQKSSVRMNRYVAPAPPDEMVDEGDIIEVAPFRFKVLWTPGHSRGHLSLYEAERKVLICGDHILPGITPNIGRHPQSGDNPLQAYLESLDRISRMAIDLALPGHEDPFRNLVPRIGELRRHHQERGTAILKIIEAGPRTAYQISTEITWATDSGGLTWEKLAPLDKRLAVMEALSHLEYMRVQGRVTQSERGGKVYFQKA